MEQSFAVIILGGTGQVGSTGVTKLLATSECREVVLVTRKAVLRRDHGCNVVLDTGALDFAERITVFASGVIGQGIVSAVSCVGLSSGSKSWSEEALQKLEIGVVCAFARGCRDAGVDQFCLLSAAGSTARSPFPYVRIMGMKG